MGVRGSKTSFADHTTHNTTRRSSYNFSRRKSSLEKNENTGFSLSEQELNYFVDHTNLSRSEISSIFNKFSKQTDGDQLDEEQFSELFRKLNEKAFISYEDSMKFVFDTFDTFAFIFIIIIFQNVKKRLHLSLSFFKR